MKNKKKHLIEAIGYIETDFKEKFGIPRQSGIIPELEGKIFFENKFRNLDAIRGLEDFTHLWLIWQFSENIKEDWLPTIRPPRLGGKEKKGVFATRSPFRPNNLGLSCVKLDRIEERSNSGPIIYVRGADLLDGTPIYDIKPYIPYADCISQAGCSFAKADWERKIKVIFPKELSEKVDENKRQGLIKILEQDPRPAYKEDSDKIYSLTFANYNLGFVVKSKYLEVVSVISV